MFKRVVHPGAILKDELEELGITPTEFARQIDVPRTALARSLLANAPSPAIPPCASATGSTSIHNSGSICKPSSSSQSQPRKQAKRSATCQPRPICQYRQSSRDWCEGFSWQLISPFKVRFFPVIF